MGPAVLGRSLDAAAAAGPPKRRSRGTTSRGRSGSRSGTPLLRGRPTRWTPGAPAASFTRSTPTSPWRRSRTSATPRASPRAFSRSVSPRKPQLGGSYPSPPSPSLPFPSCPSLPPPPSSHSLSIPSFASGITGAGRVKGARGSWSHGALGCGFSGFMAAQEELEGTAGGRWGVDQGHSAGFHTGALSCVQLLRPKQLHKPLGSRGGKRGNE